MGFLQFGSEKKFCLFLIALSVAVLQVVEKIKQSGTYVCVYGDLVPGNSREL